MKIFDSSFQTLHSCPSPSLFHQPLRPGSDFPAYLVSQLENCCSFSLHIEGKIAANHCLSSNVLSVFSATESSPSFQNGAAEIILQREGTVCVILTVPSRGQIGQSCQSFLSVSVNELKAPPASPQNLFHYLGIKVTQCHHLLAAHTYCRRCSL